MFPQFSVNKCRLCMGKEVPTVTITNKRKDSIFLTDVFVRSMTNIDAYLLGDSMRKLICVV